MALEKPCTDFLFTSLFTCVKYRWTKIYVYEISVRRGLLALTFLELIGTQFPFDAYQQPCPSFFFRAAVNMPVLFLNASCNLASSRDKCPSTFICSLVQKQSQALKVIRSVILCLQFESKARTQKKLKRWRTHKEWTRS